MVDKKGKVTASLDEALQASRKERNAQLAQEMLGTTPQKLVDEMLGKARRSSTPRTTSAGPGAATLASRAGVTKRSNSLPRSSTAPPRNTRTPTTGPRPGVADRHGDNHRSSNMRNAVTISSDTPDEAKSNGHSLRGEANGANGTHAQEDLGLSIRGAAKGEFVVRAQNFAPGTTAADIESVMQNVGGTLNYCKLIASTPTVIAEISFVEKVGAEKVISTFNGKKADGRTLYVYMESENGAPPYVDGRTRRPQPPAVEEIAVVDTVGDVAMEVDEHADAREAENRQREERRRDARPPPTGPSPRVQDYPREPRRAEPDYQDGRYGFDNRDRRYGGGPPPRYREDSRFYSDRMRHGGGGHGYRPQYG